MRSWARRPNTPTARDDVVAGFDRGHTLADALDDGASLVPEDAWKEALRIGALPSVDVCVA